LKGGSENRAFCLWVLCEGNLEGGSPAGDPEVYVVESSGDRLLFIRAPLGSMEGCYLPGTLKGGGASLSVGAL
jgi:hypothetical protein